MQTGSVRRRGGHVFESKTSDEKLVIPRWRHWKTDLQGDIARDSPAPSSIKELAQLAEIKELFKEEIKEVNLPPRVAARLANEAMLLGESSVAKDIAQSIHSSKALLAPSRDFLKGLLAEGREELVSPVHDRDGYISELGRIRQLLNKYPKNPVLWLERARLYTILSEKEKAEKCVTVALSLAPSNRYIVRSSVRFFMHFDEWDAAWYYAYRGFSENPDPWLKSLTISVGSRDEVRKKLPSFRSRIVEARTPAELFSLSELNAAIGNLELLNGNEMKAKKLFRYSWKNPSSTVISHGVWLLNNKFKGLSDSVHFDLTNNVQGSAYRLMEIRDYEQAIPTLNQWRLEEPYSSEPHMLLYHAYINLRKYNDAVSVAKLGYKSNPKEIKFLNLIAYALLRSDNKKDWNEASDALEVIENVSGGMEDPVPQATKGMCKILLGDVEAGIQLYKSSLKKFTESKKVEDRLVCASNLLMNLIRFYEGVPFKVYGEFLKGIAKNKSNYAIDSRQMLEYVAEKYKDRQLDNKSVEACLEINEH